MEKRKKSKIKILGLKLNEVIRLGTIVGACFWAWNYMDQRFDSMDRRFEKIDERFDRIEVRLGKIETELMKTSDLLDSYLAWRFIYVNDPVKKNLIPVYDPRTRTLEFVNRK